MNLSPLAVQKFFSSLGLPLIGGKLFTYVAGTTTKVATYQNRSGTLNANPIILNFRGECNLWLDLNTSYKFVLAPAFDSDPPTNPIWTVDEIQAPLGLLDLYPRTPGEISAGVFPVDYRYPASPYIDPRRYGLTTADSTGTTNRAAIQTAVDVAAGQNHGGVVQIPEGEYLVANTPDTNGVLHIRMRSNVTLRGMGRFNTVIKAPSGSGGVGTFGRIIGTATTIPTDIVTPGISNAVVEELSVDGNKAGQVSSTQYNNILISAESNVNITVRNTEHYNVNGSAIQVVGKTTGLARGILITENRILDANNIGIQVSQFQDLIIANNSVSGTLDNGIDIFGDDGTVNPSSSGFVISDNVVNACGLNGGGTTGIFPETVQDGTITGNSISNCPGCGMHVNRINGAPRDIVISGNHIGSCPTGILVTAQCDGLLIEGNTISDYTIYGVELNGSSFVSVDMNFFRPGIATAAVGVTGPLAADLKGKFNVVRANPITVANLTNITAVGPTEVAIDSYIVLPFQVGSDVKARYFQYTRQAFTITAGNAITPDLTTGNFLTITASGATMTVNAPVNMQDGAFLEFTMRNTSGGATAITWNAVFKMAAWVNPANGNSRSINFIYDGTNWIERFKSAADVPN